MDTTLGLTVDDVHEPARDLIDLPEPKPTKPDGAGIVYAVVAGVVLWALAGGVAWLVVRWVERAL